MDRAQHLEAVDLRHAEIDDRHIGRQPRKLGHHRVTSAAADHVEPFLAREPLDDVDHHGLVVDDEHNRAAFARPDARSAGVRSRLVCDRAGRFVL